MFSFIKKNLQKIYYAINDRWKHLFSASAVNEQTLKELELILLQADTGVSTTRTIINNLKELINTGAIQAGSDLKTALRNELIRILSAHTFTPNTDIILLVGINGSGKTTCAAKMAYSAQKKGKRALFIAADTFRAAAPEQLRAWADTIGIDIEISQLGQDPASIIFKGCQRFQNGGYDTLIIDTAGRLQSKTNLMHELEKIKRVITKQLPNKNICTLLTIDAMLGQNSFEQAQLFNESTEVSGIILTKLDGTGKGGIIFSIVDKLHIPVAYISYGEGLEAYSLFNIHTYVHELLDV